MVLEKNRVESAILSKLETCLDARVHWAITGRGHHRKTIKKQQLLELGGREEQAPRNPNKGL